MTIKKHVILLLSSILFILTISCSTKGDENTNKSDASTIPRIDSTNTDYKTTKWIKTIDNIKVEFIQNKNIQEDIGNNLYCNAEIKIYSYDKLIDSVIYSNIEPVGSNYGLLVYDSLFYNCLIISKFGDYDGQTIIINNEGNIYKAVGGIISVDNQNGLLFSEYCSDSRGFSVFDTKNFKELISMTGIDERPIEFYKDRERYFFKAVNDETEDTSFWEIEFDLKRIIAIDFNTHSLQDKQLKNLIDYKKTHIQCE